MKQFLFLFFIVLNIPVFSQEAIPVFHDYETGLFKKPDVLSKTALQKIRFLNDLGIYEYKKSDGKSYFGAVNKQGKIVLEPLYVNITAIAPGLWAMCEEGTKNYKFYTHDHGKFGFDRCSEYEVRGDILYCGDHLKWGAILFKGKKPKYVAQEYKNIKVNGKTLLCEQYNFWEVESGTKKKFNFLSDSLIFSSSSLILFNRNSFWGLASSSDGKELTPVSFSKIERLRSQFYIGACKGRWLLIDSDGKVLPVSGDSIVAVGEDYLKVFDKGKGWWLYKLRTDQKQTPNEHTWFGEIGTPSEGLVSVKSVRKPELWGFADEKGSMVIEPQYTYASSFKNGKATVEYEGKKAVIDPDGDTLVNSSDFYLYKSGLYTVDSIGKIHYKISPDKYSSLRPLVRGLVLASEKNATGVIDSTGKIIIPIQYEEIRGPYPEGIFIVSKGNLKGIMDIKGNVLSELSDKYEKIFNYNEARARFMKAGKYGFIDSRGNVRVAPQYKEAHDFKEGFAAVPINGKWGFIDKDENIVVQPQYSEVKDFEKGLARCKAGKQWFFVTTKGSRVSESGYDDIIEAEGGKWIIVKNGKKGLADTTGRELLAPRYENVQDMLNGQVIVKKEGKWGMVDYKENFIIPITYDFITFSKEDKKIALMMKSKEKVITVEDQK